MLCRTWGFASIFHERLVPFVTIFQCVRLGSKFANIGHLRGHVPVCSAKPPSASSKSVQQQKFNFSELIIKPLYLSERQFWAEITYLPITPITKNLQSGPSNHSPELQNLSVSGQPARQCNHICHQPSHPQHARRSNANNRLDHGTNIHRQIIAAPCHVAIGADQHQSGCVKGGDLRIVHKFCLQRDVPS